MPDLCDFCGFPNDVGKHREAKLSDDESGVFVTCLVPHENAEGRAIAFYPHADDQRIYFSRPIDPDVW